MQALKAPRIFDGETWHEDAALLVKDGLCTGITHDIPKDAVEIGADMLVPGFVDLQVNGGGGVLFNDDPSVETIRQMIEGHRRFGTTSLLPTLITDTPERTRKALAAAQAAVGTPGFLGLHLEGPHLDLARKGAHHADLIRPMTKADQEALIGAKKTLPVLLTTLAPEATTPAQIKALDAAGVIVSLGHSDCSYEMAKASVNSGASLVTHLFNAMSPLAHREPGLVGAALDLGGLSAGIIADGIHVSVPALRNALRAKSGPGRIFLVTDAMSPIGSDLTEFTLNGRTILRRDGRLTLEDGTLAGADIDMAASVRFLVKEAGVPLEEALKMASRYPAQAVGQGKAKGGLRPGMSADITALDNGLDVVRTWIGGNAVD